MTPATRCCARSAICLKSSFRDEDVPCRFGGEEFVVLLPGATVEAAAHKAEEIRARIEGLVVRYVDGNLPRITISIGVAAYPGAGDSPQSVLKSADEALYRAKDGGRNRVETSSGTDASASPIAAQVRSLQRAVEASPAHRPHPRSNGATIVDAA